MDSKEINSLQLKESKINDSLPNEKPILPADPTPKEDQRKYFTPAQHRRYQRKQAIKNKPITYGPECEKDRIRILENALVSVVEESLALLDKKRPLPKSNELKSKPHIHHPKHSLFKADEIKKPNLKKEHKPSTESHENKEGLTLKMDSKASDKSREEVQAAREAKKAAKQLAKIKNKSDVTEKIVEIKTAKKDEPTIEKVVPKTEKKAGPIINKKPETTNEKINERKIDKIEYIRPKSDKVPAIIVDSQKVKSQGVVKVQRDSKELAKQSEKTKGKTSSDITSLESKISKVRIQDTPPKDVAAIQKQTVIKKEKPDIEVEKQEKTKSELKAERRAKQEAQRAAKELLQGAKPNPASDVKKQVVKTTDKLKPTLATAVNVKISQSPEKTKLKLIQSQHKVKLFNHLYGERETAYLAPSIPLNSKEIHPAIVRLGVQYASHIIMGSNARCIALLNALKQVIDDYTLPPNVEFSRGLEAHLTLCMNFLRSCRLPAVSMNNAIKHIKWQLTQLPNTIAEYDAKAKLNKAIDTYVTEQIEVAGQAISIAVCNKISNGDVILTYGCSSLIEKIVTEAAVSKNFRVVVVAAHPWNEGREMLRRLTAKGVKCSLIMISALSFVMREINKVILGAGALLANGYVMARAGTAQVAMVANAHNVPVLVCCETHKFSERVQTDSFVYNEIGNPDDLLKCEPNQDSPLANWRTYNSLTLLNLTYDVTPPDLVTAVVTELAILPCTSVPVILRIKPSEFVVTYSEGLGGGMRSGGWSGGGAGGGRGAKYGSAPAKTYFGAGSPVGSNSNNTTGKPLSPSRRGLGISAWGIIAIIISAIMLVAGTYYFFIFYPLICKKERNYDVMELHQSPV